ncbi:hypothetical protein ACFQ14_05700 [Pseudahrensia aquimaris]|uniref:Uncharacterized protein n=1 Tax=Pseudahrensia aquimaris TaxID=744461 RepID=A0ABW3FGC6_9HYPH
MSDKRTTNPISAAIVRSLAWVDNRKSVDRFFWGLVAGGAVLTLLDLLYKKKSYFSIENIFGFYAFYGFFMCAALVVCAKAMRRLVMRSEAYYAPHDVESEAHPEADLDRRQADE